MMFDWISGSQNKIFLNLNCTLVVNVVCAEQLNGWMDECTNGWMDVITIKFLNN